MSLYNLLFGTNPFAPVLLKLLGLELADIPRFRDAYLADEGATIAIHTRTGGGNRACECHEEWKAAGAPDRINADSEGALHYNDCWAYRNWNLTQHPNYRRDEDDDFDNTYATFFFSVPEPARPVIAALLADNADQGHTPRQKWDDLLTKLQGRDQSDPVVQRALEVGKGIVDQLNQKLAEGGGVVEV